LLSRSLVRFPFTLFSKQLDRKTIQFEPNAAKQVLQPSLTTRVPYRRRLSSISKYTMHESRWLVKLSTCQLAVSSALCLPAQQCCPLPLSSAADGVIQCTRKIAASDAEARRLCGSYFVLHDARCGSRKARRNALIALNPRGRGEGGGMRRGARISRLGVSITRAGT